MCINHSRRNKLARLQPHHNCITVSLLAENADCVIMSGGNGGEVSDFPGGGGDDAEVVVTDSEGAGSGSVDEGADDDEFWRRAEGELRRHGEEVGEGLQ